jgi:multidrug efflux pump subunit AcrB
MNFMGYSLNLISLSGLMIGVGMMVDNSIVVIDSCFNAKKENKAFMEAAIDGTKSVLMSIFAVTMTTVVVFVPIAVTGGMAGQMFGPLGLSIVFALVASLLSAVTLVPLFFLKFKPVERENAPVAKIFKHLENGYAKLLQIILMKKKTVVVVTLATVGISLYLATFLNFELMPAMDGGTVTISIDTRPGLQLENVDAILAEVEEIIAVHPDVDNFMLRGGGSGGATLTAFLYSDRQMQTNEIVEQFRIETGHILDADINISAYAGGGGGGSDIEITIQGDNLDSVRDGSFLVEEVMSAHPDIIRVNSSIGRTNPQTSIRVDPLMAAFHNISPQAVAGAVFLGLNGSEAAEITIDNQRYSVWVQYPQGRYESISDVANMMIMSAAGMSVPLTDIATLEFTDTPQSIVRQNGLYTVTITGVPIEETRFTAASEIAYDVNLLNFPVGVSLGQGFTDELMAEEFASLGIAIVIAILLVFMVMSMQFESIRHSLMVMMCIPLALIGSLLLMFVTATTINMVSLIGFLVLIGLVVNNGILFVDTTNRYLKIMELQEALIHAGRTRLRPILMISMTTILAMLPLALGIGDSDMMQGLGVTVIGGLSASTLLALVLLPTFYLIIGGKSATKSIEI